MTPPWTPRPGDRVRLRIRLAECPPCPHCGAQWLDEGYSGVEYVVTPRLTQLPVEVLCSDCLQPLGVNSDGWFNIKSDGRRLFVPYTWLEPVL